MSKDAIKKAREGRPTKVTEALIAKAWDYVKDSTAYGDPVPLVAGLAIEIGVTRESVYLWAKEEGSEFFYIVKDLMAQQERRLVGKGVTKEFDSAITRTMLSKHGYAEKTEVHNTISLDNISDEELNARIAAYLK
jgi:hypothetical protein